MPDRARARHMALRLTRAAEKEGIAETGLLARVHELAMEPRHLLLEDDHDPRYLHPGRTALVALGDGGVRDPVALAAALLTETVSSDLEVPEAALAAERDTRVLRAWAMARAVPRPWDEELAERLVTADEPETVLALCEWLDQLRHLRIWAPGAVVAEGQRVTRDVYLPVAERAHAGLARRLRWWMRRVDPGLGASS